MNAHVKVSHWFSRLTAALAQQRWLLRSVRPVLTADVWVPLLSGALLAGVLLVGLSRYLLLFGFEAAVVGPLVLVAGMMLALAQWWGATESRRTVTIVQWGTLMGWTLLTPTLLKFFAGCMTSLSWGQLANSATSFPVLALVALCVLGPIFFCTGRLLWGVDRSRVAGGLLLTGFTAAWLCIPLTVAAWWGTGGVSYLCLAGMLAVMMAEWLRRADAVPSHAVRSHVSSESALALVVVCLTGALLPTLFHVGHQFVPASIFSVTSLWGGLLLGTGLAGWFRPSHTALTTRLLVFALWCVAILALYPTWTETHLRLSAFVGNPWLLFPARCGLLALSTLPAGWLAGDALVPAGRNTEQTGLGLTCLTIGGLGGLCSPGTPGQILTALAVVFATATLCLFAMEWRRQPKTNVSRWQALATAATWLVAVGGLFGASNYNPNQSERLLFSSQTFFALQSGTPSNWLTHLDERRLISARDTVDGRWSVWRFRANQYEIRHDGIVTGLAAAPSAIGPQNPTELLPVALPLTIAVRAEHVLLLGLAGPTQLETAMQYPVKSVTILEPSQPAIDLARDLDSSFGTNAFLDDRVQVISAPFTLAMLSGPPRHYDVIIASSSQIARLPLQSTFTAEFYAGVRRQLTADGLFCQRLAYFDLGPNILRDIANSLTAAFPQVTLLETAPGELLFLAANQPRQFVDSELIDQLQKGHSRRVFSQIGWDWSVATRISMVSDEQLRELCASGASESAMNSHLSWRLPVEIARWDQKAQQSRALLAQHATSLGAGLSEFPEAIDIVHRLEDVEQKYLVTTTFTDQYWAYRKVLKERLQDRPRTEIQQVKGAGLKHGLHPEDARRKAYLQVLGEIAKTEQPTSAQIEALVEFCEPYDPLLTQFAHYEAAHLYARAVDGTPRTAYNHWLHCVLTAPAADRSVRTVCAAIQMLNQYPECVDTPADRWDHLNALLEEMERRWALRMTATERSKYEPIDINRSLEAAQSAVKTLASIAPEVPVTDADWQLRKAVLEDSLLRPLRAERSLQAARNMVQP